MAEAKLIIKPPHMLVRMKPGAWPDLPKMVQTIHDAGYKPIEGGVELRVTGKLGKQGNRLQIEVVGMKAPITLWVAPGEDSDLAAYLEKQLGQSVDLEGRWQPAPNVADGRGLLAQVAVYRPDAPKPR